MPMDPKASAENPIPSKTRPSPYFVAPLGLYLLSHHLENKGAKIMIKREFKIKNQVAGISISFSLILFTFAFTMVLFSFALKEFLNVAAFSLFKKIKLPLLSTSTMVTSSPTFSSMGSIIVTCWFTILSFC